MDKDVENKIDEKLHDLAVEYDLHQYPDYEVEDMVYSAMVEAGVDDPSALDVLRYYDRLATIYFDQERLMKDYIVIVKEIHMSYRKVSAETPEEALELAGDEEEICLEYLDTLNDENWVVREIKDDGSYETVIE